MNTISLLVLDDEVNVVASLRRLFREPKYTFYAATQPQEAFAILNKHEIGVVICDYRMDAIKGTDFLAQTKKKWPDMSRILLTGYFNSQIATHSLKNGEVFRFISKPWIDDDLKMTVDHSWKRYRLLKENRQLLKLTRSQNTHLKHLTENLKEVIENRIEKLVESKNAVNAKKIQLQMTHSIIKNLGKSKNLKEIYKIVVTGLNKLIAFDKASIILELNPGEHHLLSQNTRSSEKNGFQSTPVNIMAVPFIRQVFENREPMILDGSKIRFTPIRNFWTPWKNKNYTTHLIFPLLRENAHQQKCMATLNLATKSKKGFTSDDVRKLSDVAQPIAIAIEKIKLLEIVERGSRQWESTFDAISDLVTVIDKDFTLIKANRATEKITGRKVNTVIKEKCYEVLAQRKSPCRNCPAIETLRTQTVTEENEIIDFKDKDYLSWAYPVKGGKNSTDTMVVYYRDHTHASQLYRQLIQAEKMAAIGHLAGSLAHELNNPLTGITAFAQILKQELGKKNPLYSDIVEVEKASFRCKDIIDNLLQFSEKQNTKKKRISINQIINATLPLIQYSASGKQNVKITKRLDKKDPKIQGNANQLQQVFLNLLLNAFQAMPKGGNVTIKTSFLKKQRAIQVTVTDTGVGIPKQYLSKIFDPFYTTKERTRGTGLGLSVSYGIIRDHQGKLQVQSHLKKGSTFKVILPLEKRD